MPKYFHHFLPLSPPVSLEELENIRCLQEIAFETRTRDKLMIRLLGRPHTIDVIAVTVPYSAPIDQRGKWIEQIGNHMISTLRLTYDATADVVRNGDGFLNLCTETDDSQPTYTAAIKLQCNDNHIVNVQNVASFFCDTLGAAKAPIISLLAEAQTPAIPTHYKVLSLIRALEVLFPIEQERFAWLDRYESQFAAIEISRRCFRNALPELRTKCAHGVSRGGSGPLVAQAYGELQGMPLLLTLLRTVVADRVKEQHGVGIEIGLPITAQKAIERSI
ncbi:hypothetical protein [Collimonas fungivorans]|uniref:hypothetical protein n=1 Tax=Collimonas fungivorans TaxID=158899 RepID=UPI003FA3B4E7